MYTMSITIIDSALSFFVRHFVSAFSEKRKVEYKTMCQKLKKFKYW